MTVEIASIENIPTKESYLKPMKLHRNRGMLTGNERYGSWLLKPMNDRIVYTAEADNTILVYGFFGCLLRLSFDSIFLFLP